MNYQEMIERLRFNDWLDPFLPEVANRIEKALDEREQALNACEKTLDERDEALAKLAKAVEALRAAQVYIDDLRSHEGAEGFSTSTNQAADTYYAALAELEGR